MPLFDNLGYGEKRARDFNGCMRMSVQGVGAREMSGMMFMFAVVATGAIRMNGVRRRGQSGRQQRLLCVGKIGSRKSEIPEV